MFQFVNLLVLQMCVFQSSVFKIQAVLQEQMASSVVVAGLL